MAVIRVTDCSYQPLIDRCILSVDIFYTDDADSDSRSYIVVAPSRDICTEEQMKSFIEQDICSQRTATPNWTGSAWKSTRV